ncbi:MAG: hypothetical protein M3292_06325 [Actinomycetota bacterium]|nr:hypothetical protein [Actinomycetota bacterium]
MTLTYRERPPARRPAGLLVLHHGRGADERDLLPLADVLDAKRRLRAGADLVIGVSFGRRASELLKNGCLDVEYHESDAGHSIDPRHTPATIEWLASTVPPDPPTEP